MFKTVKVPFSIFGGGGGRGGGGGGGARLPSTVAAVHWINNEAVLSLLQRHQP